MDQLVRDGVSFLRSLTEHYGSEKGLEIWNAFGEVLGKEVKGKVFFALMTGETSGRVRFTVNTSKQLIPNAVSCIRTMRSFADLTLKEAKDLFDQSKNEVVVVDCKTPEDGMILARELRNLGCEVV